MTTDLAGSSQVIFRLVGPISAEDLPDVLGLWAAETQAPQPSEPQGQAVSYSIDASLGEAAPQWPRWIADMPAQPELADMRLAGAERSIAVSRSALEEAEARLDAFVSATLTPPGPSPGLAFGVSSTEVETRRPELELAALLRAGAGQRPSVSFDMRETLGGSLEQVVEAFRSFVHRLVQSIAHYAWVDTYIEGTLLARTAVGWSGDVNTVWTLKLTPDQVSLHERTLALALESRDALLRTLALTAQGALRLARLAALMGTPLAPILALSITWRFITQVLAEVRARQTPK